jgi:hypothetical protein
MSRQADRRAHLDLQISLLAEHCIPCDGSPPRFREAKPPAFYKRSQKADSSAAPHNAIFEMTRTGHEPTLADTGVSSPRFFPLTRHPAHAGIQVVSAPISLDIRSRLYDGNAVVYSGSFYSSARYSSSTHGIHRSNLSLVSKSSTELLRTKSVKRLGPSPRLFRTRRKKSGRRPGARPLQLITILMALSSLIC